MQRKSPWQRTSGIRIGSARRGALRPFQAFVSLSLVCGCLSFWTLIDRQCALFHPDDVEKVIGLLLREFGDRLNEQVRKRFLSPFSSYRKKFCRISTANLGQLMVFCDHLSSIYNTLIFQRDRKSVV